jgi:hypothetical protein
MKIKGVRGRTVERRLDEKYIERGQSPPKKLHPVIQKVMNNAHKELFGNKRKEK